MKSKIVWALALAVLLLALVPGSVRAEGIELVYDLNFATSLAHVGKWNRLEVTVLNKGSEDMLGTLVVDAGAKYSQEIFLEAGKSAKAIFYLPPANMDGNSWNNANTIVTMQDSRGKELKRIRVSAGNHNLSTDYIGMLGSGPGGLNLVASFPNSRVVRITPTHLDHLPFAENISIIIINDPEPIAMSPMQEENLRHWVEQGGVLILGGGSGWQRTTDLVPTDLLPVLPQGVGTVTAQDLQALKFPVPPQGQNFTVALGENLGNVTHAVGDIPLVVQKNSGRGIVIWSALDLAAAPLDETGNSIFFWKQLNLSQSSRANYSEHKFWIYNNMFNSISQDGIASALSPLKIFLLLLAYILLAGPINWLILRKLDRREWAWLTIPVLALLFTTGAFTAGRIGRGTERILYHLNMVDVYSENLAGVNSFSGVFVPSRGELNLSTQAAAVAPQGGGEVTRFADGTTLSFGNPPLWSVQRFFVTDYLALPGNFSLEAKMDGFKSSSLAAEIVNNSGHALFDSYLRLGKHWYHVGALEAGGRKTADPRILPAIDFSRIIQHYSDNAPVNWIELGDLLQNKPVLFVGFGEEGVLAMDGAEKVVALDIWIQPYAIDSIDFGQGPISIPPGVLTPEVLPGFGIHDHWNNQFEFRGQGSLDLVFPLPGNLDYSQGQFTLNMNIWGDGQGSLTAFNHVLGEWQELTDLGSLNNRSQFVSLENPGELIQNNNLLVRVNYDGHLGFDAQGIDITLEEGWIND